MKQKKIVLISNTANSIVGFRKHLIEFLVKKQCEVYCFATDYNERTIKEVEQLGAFPVSYNLKRGGLNPLEDLKSLKTLIKLLKGISPDIVMSNFVKPVIYGTLAARIVKVPRVIAMLEGLGFPFTEQPKGVSFKTKLIKITQVFLYKLALPNASMVIFLNKDDYKDLLLKYKIKVKKHKVLGGIGLNLKDYPYSDAPIKTISFLFIGRLLREKGVFEYLEAAKKIKKKYPEVVFNVIGGLDEENPGGIDKKELDKYIKNETIVYPGYVYDVSSWIKKSSVFVLPSYREGYPRSTQEAMAIGRAIITTDVPGCRETVNDGKNGFLIPKWNVDALVEKMEYFIQNKEKITEMGVESCRIAVERFDGDKVNNRILKLIEQL